MKIAVFHNLPLGGQKRALYYQVKFLSKKHLIDLYTLTTASDSSSFSPFINKHFQFEYDNPTHFPKSVFSIYKNLPKIYQKIAQNINNGNYDVAYINPCFFTQAPYLLKYLKIPSVYYCPEPKREFYEKIPHRTNYLTYHLTYPFRYPLKFIDIANSKEASLVLTNSRYSKMIIDRIYDITSQINYLGIDSDLFKPIDTTQNYFLSVGDVSLHKGYDFIIRSLRGLKDLDKYEYLIVGFGGSEVSYIRTLAQRYNIKLKILINVKDRHLITLYQNAKAFLYAAIREPLGLVLLEAASCGVPIVSIKEGGVDEILTDQVYSSLVKRKEDNFNRALETVLSNNKTSDYKKKQYLYIKKRWDWSSSVANLEKHLLSILS